MTEYDYSPKAYERYLHTQSRIARWVDRIPLLSTLREAVDSNESPSKGLAHCSICGSSATPLERRGLGSQICIHGKHNDRRIQLSLEKAAAEDHPGGSEDLVIDEAGNYVITPIFDVFSSFTTKKIDDFESEDPASCDEHSGSTTAHMFTNARNVSIRDATIHNARRDNITVIHNHNYPADPSFEQHRDSSPHENDPEPAALNFISRVSTLFSRASSRMFHAADMIKTLLPNGFSTLLGMHLGDSAAQDTTKYPPLNAMMLLSRTTMCIPGFTSQTLSSIRYAFFSC